MKLLLVLTLSVVVLSSTLQYNPFDVSQFFNGVNFQNAFNLRNGLVLPDGQPYTYFTINFDQNVPQPTEVSHFCCGQHLPVTFDSPFQQEEQTQENNTQEQETTEAISDQPFDIPAAVEVEQPSQILNSAQAEVNNSDQVSAPILLNSQQKPTQNVAANTDNDGDDDDSDDEPLPSWVIFLIFVSIFVSFIAVSKIIQAVKQRRNQVQSAAAYGNNSFNQTNISDQIQFHYSKIQRLQGLQSQQQMQYDNTASPIGYINTSNNDYSIPRPTNPTNIGYGRFA